MIFLRPLHPSDSTSRGEQSTGQGAKRLASDQEKMLGLNGALGKLSIEHLKQICTTAAVEITVHFFKCMPQVPPGSLQMQVAEACRSKISQRHDLHAFDTCLLESAYGMFLPTHC